jgi:histone deacetylase HOS3
MGMASRPGSAAGTPKLSRRGSRQSLGADELEKRPTPKRSISNLIANLRESQATMDVIEEPVPLTAPQIAVEHFTRELVAHGDATVEAETVVILHDACYGHRYSRLKATKATLSMIVERPERLLASVLGASAAYVRLGEHYAGARNAPRPARQQAVPPPFKIRRTQRAMDVTSTFVTNVHGTAWMAELRKMCYSAADKLAAGAKELSRASTPTDPEKRALHEGDLYLCPESLDAFQGALGGVADAVDSVFQPNNSAKRAFVAIRPPGHHCSADHPSGFCWLNNVHVGIEYAAQTYGLTHAAILDFDLHHGDGSQAITWERNSRNNQKRLSGKPISKLKLGPDIGYYSLHDISSYPCEMGDDEKVQSASLCIENAHGQSIWNVHLQPWKTEEEFWELYESRYMVLLEKARQFLQHHSRRLRAEGKIQPKAAIFISAGFDASEWEGSGMQRHKVNVPTEFYARFTKDVVQLAQEAGCGCDGRVISVLEGGYSDRALCSGILSHLSGLCAKPTDIAVKKEEEQPAGLGLDDMMRGLRIESSAPLALTYDKTWWSAANLTELETKVFPPPPPGPGKKVRTGPQPTYATPTESFAYKVVDPNKFARSISGTLRDSPAYARPETPPPPEVDWVTATQELHKLLVPTNRTTKSCTADELGGGKVKKEKPSVVAPPPAVEGARQLRERKARVPFSYAESAHSDEVDSVRSVSRSSNTDRRQTLHEFPVSGEGVETAAGDAATRASRRMSAGSALSAVDGVLDPEPPPVPPMRSASGVRPVGAPANGLKGRAGGNMKPPPVPAPKASTTASGGPSALGVHKTRAPSRNGRRPPSTMGAPAAAPPAALHEPHGPQAAKAAPVFSQPPSRSGSTTPSIPTGSEGVDALTAGMKKVTLNLKVGSREESERRQKERLEKEAAERRARALKGAETRRFNKAAKERKEREAAEAAVKGAPSAPPVPAPVDLPVQQPSEPVVTTLPATTTEMQLHVVTDAEMVQAPLAFHIDPAAQQTIAPPQYQPMQEDRMHTMAGAPIPIPAPAPAPPAAAPLDHGLQPAIATPPQPLALHGDLNGMRVDAPMTAQQAHSEPPFEPDSAARQLIQENDLANGSMAAVGAVPPPTQPSFGSPPPAQPYLAPSAPAEPSFATATTPSSPPTVRSPNGKTKLPVWSATGHIPFASPPPQSPTTASGPISPRSPKNKTNVALGMPRSPKAAPSSPKSPRRLQQQHQHQRRVSRQSGSRDDFGIGFVGDVVGGFGEEGNGVSTSMLRASELDAAREVEAPNGVIIPERDRTLENKEMKEENTGMSIWDVPETPVKR